MTEALQPERLLRETRWLERLARGLCADPERAADVAQETLARALKRPPRIGPEGPRPWLATVARNLVRRERRRAAQRARGEREARAREGHAPAAGDVVARAEVHRAAVEAVLALEEPLRRAVLLRFLDDLPPRVVAAELGVGVETSRTWIRRGLERVRHRLDRRAGGRRAWTAVLGFVPPSSIVLEFGTVTWMATKTKLAAAIAVAAIASVVTWNAWSGAPERPLDGVVVAPDGEVPPRGTDLPVVARGASADRAALEAQPARVPGSAYTLRGIVVAEESRTPLPGARVALHAAPSALAEPPGEVAVTLTDGSGAFVLGGAATAGTSSLRLVVTADERARVERRVSARGDPMLPTEANQGEIAVPRGVAVRGRVTRADGSAVADATIVVASRFIYAEDGRSVLLREAFVGGRSADDGSFALVSHLIDTAVLIAVHDDGLALQRLTDLRRTGGEKVTELELEPAFELELSVQHASGEPAAGVRVDVQPQFRPLGWPSSTPFAAGPLSPHWRYVTDAAGFVRIPGLMRGAPGWIAWVGSDTPLAVRVAVEEPELGAVSRRVVRLPVGTTVRVAGTVRDTTGSPVQDARLTAGSAAAATDERGRYALDVPRALRLPDVFVRAPQKALAVVTPRAAPEQTVVGLDVTLAPGGDLHGRVVDDEGAPVADVHLRAGRVRARTGADGAFVLGNLPFEPTEIHLWSLREQLGHDALRGDPRYGPVTIEVRRENGLRIPLDARVVDAEGAAVEPVDAEVVWLDGEEDVWGYSVRREIGRVVAELPRAGRWAVRARAAFGIEAEQIVTVTPATEAVRATLVITRGVSIRCEVALEVPPGAEPPHLAFYSGRGGQRLRFAARGQRAHDNGIVLDLSRGRSFTLEDVDPTRPVVVVLHEPRFAAVYRLDPRDVAGVARLPVRIAGQLVLRSREPWPVDELVLELHRGGEPEPRPPLRFGRMQSRTELLRWSLEPGAWRWRVSDPAGTEPAAGALEIASDEDVEIVIRAPR